MLYYVILCYTMLYYVNNITILILPNTENIEKNYTKLFYK